jgi:4-alpha-glucanotransferase
MKFDRSSGILLHPTSLPGNYGIGSLGKEAFSFVDFLARAKQSYWQILPLGPTGYGDSPYQCFSSIAGNPLLIDLDLLKKEGWLSTKELATKEKFPEIEVNYPKVIAFKGEKLKQAFTKFLRQNNVDAQMKFFNFCQQNASWLDDYALFMAIKDHNNLRPWSEWSDDLRLRNHEALENIRIQLHDEIQYTKFTQYLFFDQWLTLRYYANSKGVKIIGDIPIYISSDSVEAWSQPEIFDFDENRSMINVSGVPPDYFSATGQLWGNPIYNWNKLKETDFKWWKDRLRANLNLYDVVRIDHFRGFSEFWAVPAGEETAINGRWLPCPGPELFDSLEKEFGNLPVIAEDLGIITDDVVALRERYNFPGMKILQFAFDSDEANDYLPHTYDKGFAVYSGTHDNNTVNGWYTTSTPANRKALKEYIGYKPLNVAWEFIKLAHSSVADLSVITLQDILSLGESARMNLPGTTEGNWKWRYKKPVLTRTHEKQLAGITKIYGR